MLPKECIDSYLYFIDKAFKVTTGYLFVNRKRQSETSNNNSFPSKPIMTLHGSAIEESTRNIDDMAYPQLIREMDVQETELQKHLKFAHICSEKKRKILQKLSSNDQPVVK